MQITIDTTQPLSPEDRELIAALIGVASTKPTPITEPAVKPEQEKPATRPARKPAPKPAPEPEPEPEPEDDEDEDLLGTADDAVTMEQIVDLATKLVSSGQKPKVVAALGAVGEKKVTAVPEAKFQKFWDALNA